MPNEHIKLRAYRLIRHYVQTGRVSVFVRILEEAGARPQTSISIEQYPFYWGMRAMAVVRPSFSPNQLRRVAFGLQAAHDQNIDEEHLIGFLRRFKAGARH